MRPGRATRFTCGRGGGCDGRPSIAGFTCTTDPWRARHACPAAIGWATGAELKRRRQYCSSIRVVAASSPTVSSASSKSGGLRKPRALLLNPKAFDRDAEDVLVEPSVLVLVMEQNDCVFAGLQSGQRGSPDAGVDADRRAEDAAGILDETVRLLVMLERHVERLGRVVEAEHDDPFVRAQAVDFHREVGRGGGRCGAQRETGDGEMNERPARPIRRHCAPCPRLPVAPASDSRRASAAVCGRGSASPRRCAGSAPCRRRW